MNRRCAGPEGRAIKLPKGLSGMRFLLPALLLLAASAASAEPAKTAVFDLELIDTSQEAERGVREDQTQRLALASEELRHLLAQSAQLKLVDLAPEHAAIEKQSPLNKCNGCEEDLGK